MAYRTGGYLKREASHYTSRVDIEIPSKTISEGGNVGWKDQVQGADGGKHPKGAVRGIMGMSSETRGTRDTRH